MAIFTDKIQSANFINADNTVIEVLYKENPDDETVVSYIVEVDYTNDDFNDLINEYDLEKIEKQSQAIREQELAAFNAIVENAIAQRTKDAPEQKFVLESGNFLEFLDKNAEDTNFIFDIKVGILEDETVAKVKDKTVKTKIRKSKNLYELLAIYGDIKFKG